MPNQRQTQPEEGTTFSQKLEIGRGIAAFVAMTVMVFLRNNLGYRFLNPLHLIVMTAVLLIVAALARRSPNVEALQLFAALMLFIGLAQRFRRWLEMRRGIKQHSEYIGDSVFEFQWLPGFLRRNRRFTRYFDSIVCVVVGACLLKTCPSLGGWLIFSGLALRVLEDTVYRRQLNRDLDTVDGMVVSEFQADTVERFSEPSAEVQQQRNDAEGVATGLSPDIQQKIAQRQKRQP